MAIYDHEVSLLFSDGNRYLLSLNTSFMLLERDSAVNLILPAELGSGTLIILFENDFNTEPRWYREIEGSVIRITLNRWYSENWIENIHPISLTNTTRQISMLIKIGSMATINDLNRRKLEISIWKMHNQV